MGEVLPILLVTVCLPLWIIFHYITKMKMSKGLSPEDEKMLSEVWESAIVHCDYNSGRLDKLEIVPVVLNERADDPSRREQTRGRPRIATGSDALRILQRLQALSRDLGNDRIVIEGERAYM